MSLHARYPALSDLRDRARRRIPRFVWEYLDSGTGVEATKARNRTMLDRVLLSPSILHGAIAPDLSVTLFGQSHPLPVGIAPVGMSGLIWPEAEHIQLGVAQQGFRRLEAPGGFAVVAGQHLGQTNNLGTGQHQQGAQQGHHDHDQQRHPLLARPPGHRGRPAPRRTKVLRNTMCRRPSWACSSPLQARNERPSSRGPPTEPTL